MRNAALRQRRRSDDEDEDRPTAGRPWWWRMLMRRPRDSVAVLAALTAVIAIVVNATYLQHGRHPAPIFALRPLPVAAAATEVVGGVARPSADAVRHDGARPAPATSSAARGSRNDAIAELLATHPVPAQPQSPAQPQPAHQAAVPAARPSVPIPPPARPQPSRQVLGVQRALSEFGYGQLKPTGVFDAETRAAVQRFEREHNLPVSEDITEPMKRALANLVGHSLD